MMSDSNENKTSANATLSDFVTKFSSEQKKALFDQVIKDAIEAQNEVIRKAAAM